MSEIETCLEQIRIRLKMQKDEYAAMFGIGIRMYNRCIAGTATMSRTALEKGLKKIKKKLQIVDENTGQS